MKNSTMYKQCTLKRTENTTTTEWVPSNLAKVGKTIEFKTDGDWEGFNWTVTSVGAVERDCKDLLDKFHKSWGHLDMPRRRGK
jgi:hypothetical protein